MRFLGIGNCCDLSALYLRLGEAGHEVKVFIAEPGCRDILNGLVERVDDWRGELAWIRAAGADGIILFENVGFGELQGRLRDRGFQVVGGCELGDRLECDRTFAQRVLRSLGQQTCANYKFTSRQAAIDFVRANPARYVVKFNGPFESYVGCADDGGDVEAYIAGLPGSAGAYDHPVLMEYVAGIEMGVGAYFDGRKFLLPACLDWEHKRFFPGNLGELTGEMGTVVTYQGTTRFFEQTLARLESLLRHNGYCGYINLNTIVNSDGIWPLEFTCRFGYPGYAILEPLQAIAWADLFRGLTTRTLDRLPVHAGFAVGIVITTPPFPYSRTLVDVPVGLPVMFRGGLGEFDLRHVHFGEVARQEGRLVTSGCYGWTLVVTGTGATIPEAQRRANELADRVVVPNARFRRDIGDALIAGEYERLRTLHLVDNETAERPCIRAGNPVESVLIDQ